MERLGISKSDRCDPSRIVDIRQAMLNDLTEADESNKLTRVYVRIVFARDLQALWYLRCDAMTMLAKGVGESAASKRIATTTAMFNGLLPAAQKPRLAQLHH